MKDENCIFCKIANGEIPSYTLYEDNDFRVIFDLSPATKGHALIISKEHYGNLFELDDSIAEKVMLIAKKLVTAMKKTLNCDGFNILQNNGECAGQTVFHYHVHLIPRYNGGKEIIYWNPQTISEEKLKELSELIQENI
jgi:histidine triad (HIT) family protein